MNPGETGKVPLALALFWGRGAVHGARSVRSALPATALFSLRQGLPV
jgi:hypothetical protein